MKCQIGWAEAWLGFAELNQGHYPRARAHGETTLALGREVGDQETIGRALWLLGYAELVEEAYAEAQRYLEESVAVYRGFGLPDELILVLADVGTAALGQGAIIGDRRARVSQARIWQRANVLI